MKHYESITNDIYQCTFEFRRAARIAHSAQRSSRSNIELACVVLNRLGATAVDEAVKDTKAAKQHAE